MLIGVSGRPITAAALSRDSDTLPSGVTRKEYGVVQRMLAQRAVTPAAAIFGIVFSYRRPGAHKDHIHTLRVWFDADQVRKSIAKTFATALVNSTAVFGRLADILPRSRRANVAKADSGI